MRIRVLLVAGLLAFPLIGHAAISEPAKGASVAERAQANAERIRDADAFIEEIEDSVAMARAGEYGRLKRGTVVRIEMARDKIIKLLDGHASALDLPPEDRIELYNAQEVIVAAIRSDDKNRTVCKREMTTGSRLPTTECMTVAEREARKRNAAENTDKFIRNLCIPGEGNSCGQ
jgi:hypothetical protein